MPASIEKNRMTKRKWNRIRGRMIEERPTWAHHLRAIPYGSPEIKKAIESDEIEIDLRTAT